MAKTYEELWEEATFIAYGQNKPIMDCMQQVKDKYTISDLKAKLAIAEKALGEIINLDATPDYKPDDFEHGASIAYSNCGKIATETLKEMESVNSTTNP